MTVEEELRAAFARHEAAAPAADPLRAGITAATVRRKRRRAIVASAVAVLAMGAALPVAAATVHREPVDVTTLPLIEQRPLPADGLNILLIIADRDPGAAAARAQAVLIAHVPVGPGPAYVVGLPREERPLAGTRAAVIGLTGLDFQSTVTAGPAGVRAVTDAAGGLEVCPQPARCRRFAGAAVLHLLGGRDGILPYVGSLVHTPGLTDPVVMDRLLRVADSNGVTVNGDPFALTQLVRADRLIGVRTGPGLYAALRGDDVGPWVDAHPGAVLTR